MIIIFEKMEWTESDTSDDEYESRPDQSETIEKLELIRGELEAERLKMIACNQKLILVNWQLWLLLLGVL